MTFHTGPELKQMSTRRIDFLKDASVRPYHLSNQCDLAPIASYFEKKLKIKIYIAGDAKTNSPDYQALLSYHQDISQKFTNLAGLYMYRWNKPSLNLIFKDKLENLLKVAGYVKKNGDLRKIEPDEIEKFNESLISILQTIKKYDSAIDFLNRINKSAANEAYTSTSRFKLQKRDYVSEIKYIQAQLKDDEVVGYVMPNDDVHPVPDRSHINVVVILKDKVIKPVNWIVESHFELSKEDLPGMYTITLDLSDLSPLDKKTCKFLKIATNPDGLIIPQLRNIECGTLSFLYLKELLKENARQLKLYSLAFSYYVGNPADGSKPHKIDFFIPSPQVLRYSQSSLYNLVIYNMLLSDDEQTTVKHREKTLKVMTLRKMLLDSIQIAQKNNDIAAFTQNQKILDDLSEFRKRWIAQYQLSEEERNSMNELNGVNRFLEYKSRRFERIRFLGTVESPYESAEETELDPVDGNQDPSFSSSLSC